MKRGIMIMGVAAMLTLTACDDWLTDPSPGTTDLKDFFTGGGPAQQCVTACYQPLMWELQDTYYNEWFIGDVMSDDALKGGQTVTDMSYAYDMENWKTLPNNTLILDFYRAQYQGVGRCNLAIQEISQMTTSESMDLQLKNRLLGEAHFLRAYYYFRLVRAFGGVPLVDYVVTSSSKWRQPRATADEVYDQIHQDLLFAQQNLLKKSEYEDADLGRATKGAAEAMLMKTSLYTHDYEAAKQWGDSVMASGEYSLCQNYADNFTLEGENGPESVFEIQYVDEATSDYGEGNGFTRGTFTVVMTRPRSKICDEGWGFNRPTQNLYDEFEAGDPRRDVTIFNPTDDQIENPSEEIYMGCRYCSRKYAMFTSDDNSTWFTLSHASRGPINNKQIRYSDVLLMYAEACVELGKDAEATEALNKVRSRVGLAEFPGYTYSHNGEQVTPTLKEAIRHERRVELAMEGHRWFDLCRWGIAKETMDAYKATETAEAQQQMAEFIKGKHELLPIPSEEIDLDPLLTQNPGY